MIQQDDNTVSKTSNESCHEDNNYYKHYYLLANLNISNNRDVTDELGIANC